MTTTPQWKIDLVNKTADEMSKSPVVAFVSIKGIRNKQLQGIRRALKGDATIRIVRGALLTKALEKNGDEGFAKLKNSLVGRSLWLQQLGLLQSFMKNWKPTDSNHLPEVER